MWLRFVSNIHTYAPFKRCVFLHSRNPHHGGIIITVCVHGKCCICPLNRKLSVNGTLSTKRDWIKSRPKFSIYIFFYYKVVKRFLKTTFIEKTIKRNLKKLGTILKEKKIYKLQAIYISATKKNLFPEKPLTEGWEIRFYGNKQSTTNCNKMFTNRLCFPFS